MIHRFLRDETGATAVEYGLLIAVFSIALVSVLSALGTSIRQKLMTIATSVGAS